VINLYTFPIDNDKKLGNGVLFYYPHQITEWIIEYKPLPFMKLKKEKRKLITNLTKKETNFYDESTDSLKKVDFPIEKHIILPINYEKKDMEKNSVKYLQEHYLHKKKVWSYPTLTLLDTYPLYIPYFISRKERKGKNINILFEPITGNCDVLDNYKEIQKYLKERNVI